MRLLRRRGQRPAGADVQDEDRHPALGEPITVQPLKSFPLIKDLVTDVSRNYETNKLIPPFTPAPDDGTPWRIPQMDIDRLFEYRRCIECFLCQDVCHVNRTHELSARFFGPRFFVRVASLEMHPKDVLDRRELLGDRAGSASATSPSAAPRSAPSTSTSPTTRSSRSRSGWPTRTGTRCAGWRAGCAALRRPAPRDPGAPVAVRGPPVTAPIVAEVSRVIALIVLGAILLALVVAFILFYRHSRTPEWGDSEFRKSMLGMMVAIAPLWGMRYKEPHHELPTVSAPGSEQDPCRCVRGVGAPRSVLQGGEGRRPSGSHPQRPLAAVTGCPREHHT